MKGEDLPDMEGSRKEVRSRKGTEARDSEDRDQADLQQEGRTPADHPQEDRTEPSSSRESRRHLQPRAE